MRRSPPWALDLHRQLDALITRLPPDATGFTIILQVRHACALPPKCTLTYRDDVCADQLDSDPP